MASFHKPGTLSADEQEQIMAVVRRAEMAEDTEQERIGSVLQYNLYNILKYYVIYKLLHEQHICINITSFILNKMVGNS